MPQPHECIQKTGIETIVQDIRDIRKVIYGSRNLKMGAAISLIVALCAAAFFVFNIDAETRIMKSQISDIKTDINLMQKRDVDLKNLIKEQGEENDGNYKSIIGTLNLIGNRIDSNGKKVKKRRK